jgi:hypothetical protein
MNAVKDEYHPHHPHRIVQEVKAKADIKAVRIEARAKRRAERRRTRAAAGHPTGLEKRVARMLQDAGSSHLAKRGSARAEALLLKKLRSKGFGVRGKKRTGGGRKRGGACRV